MSESSDYLEKCIESLPLEQRPEARKIVTEMTAGGDTTAIGRLLFVFQITSSYALTIPKQIQGAGENLALHLDARLARWENKLTSEDNRRMEQFVSVLKDGLPVMAKTLSVEGLTREVNELRITLDRMDRSVSRFRPFRTSAVSLILGAGVIIGIAITVGLFHGTYSSSKAMVEEREKMKELGISTAINETEKHAIVSITNPRLMHGTTWLKNDRGYLIGVDLVIDKNTHE